MRHNEWYIIYCIHIIVLWMDHELYVKKIDNSIWLRCSIKRWFNNSPGIIHRIVSKMNLILLLTLSISLSITGSQVSAHGLDLDMGANSTERVTMLPPFIRIQGNNSIQDNQNQSIRIFPENLRTAVSEFLSWQPVDQVLTQMTLDLRSFKNLITNTYTLYRNFFTRLFGSSRIHELFEAMENYFVGVYRLFINFHTDLIETRPFDLGVIFAMAITVIVWYPFELLITVSMITTLIAVMSFIITLPCIALLLTTVYGILFSITLLKKHNVWWTIGPLDHWTIWSGTFFIKNWNLWLIVAQSGSLRSLLDQGQWCKMNWTGKTIFWKT